MREIIVKGCNLEGEFADIQHIDERVEKANAVAEGGKKQNSQE